MTSERYDVLETARRQTAPIKVSITDLDMPIGSMVVLLVKLAIAAIPAMLVIGLISLVLMFFLALLGAGLGLSKV